ncbi:unnamed protein product [Penicillium manginii]
MRYTYTFPALFAAAVIAAPLENAKRSDESLIGTNGYGYEYYEDGHLVDLGDVGLLKRDDESLIGGASIGGILKRSEEDPIDDYGDYAEDVAGYEDDVLGLLKRDDEILGGLLGGGSSSGGGSLLLKRDDESLIGSDGDHYYYDDGHLVDVGDVGLLKRNDEVLIGNDGYHDDGDLAGLGDVGLLDDSEDLDRAGDAGVKNKREEELLSTDLIGFANILKARSEDLGIDETNVITGAGVADDAQIATPILAVANPLNAVRHRAI